MFEIGRDYRITMIVAVPGDWSDETGVWTVAEVDGTLVKLTNPYTPDTIINTASWHFVRAEIV
ncbi:MULTISPECIES: hypothetical protein [unclassified Mesorhizobium]|uniref:hypothetical protein n=1 Tax=unclassified Mesorhizobium TaxID=325217 RepID=UPI0003CF28F6|nr:hypothetical protein [Mesorhizobium sp. LSHC420B00]ESX64081.1 hypothetical protein X759_32360 [Mesorhizobium sp. LSHC420B00]